VAIPEAQRLEPLLSELRRGHPDLVRDISAILSDTDAPLYSTGEWEVVPSRQGVPTLRLAGRFVHSRFDPVAEGEKRLRRFDRTGIPVFVGIGLGYLLETFRSTQSPSTVVVVFSPDELRIALQERPKEWWDRFAPDRIVPAWIPDVLPTVLSAEGINDPVPVVLDAIAARWPETAERVLATIEGHRSRSEVNRNTLRRFGKLWVRNGIRNLALSGAIPGIDSLAGVADGLPAIVCGAGPSIDDLEPVIHDLSRSHLLIAVDTAVPLLQRWGVAPHFAVVSDPQYWNTRHLDTVDLKGTVLVAEPATHPRSLRLWNGPILVSASLFPVGAFFDRRLQRHLRLGAGGSVATSGWDLARVLGSRDIALAGVDLGFPGYQTHCADSFFERRLLNHASRLSPAEHGMSRYLHGADPAPVPAAGGGDVLSDRRMEVYRAWFAEQTRRHPSVRTVLLSPESSAIPGLSVESPASRLRRLPDARSRLDRVVHAAAAVAASSATGDGTGRATTGHDVVAESVLADLKSAFLGIRDVAMRGIATCSALESDPEREISILDRIDADLLRSQSGNLAGFLAAEAVETAARTVPEDRAGAIDQATGIYEAIRNACDYHIQIIDRSLLKLGGSETDIHIRARE